MKETKSCGIREFNDARTGKCKNAKDVRRYIEKKNSAIHNIKIDEVSKKYTRQQIIDELVEFNLDYVAIDLINMVSRKKIDILPHAKKRFVAYADYWINEYNTRGAS